MSTEKALQGILQGRTDGNLRFHEAARCSKRKDFGCARPGSARRGEPVYRDSMAKNPADPPPQRRVAINAFRLTRISVRTDLLRQFLAETRQILLWCASSHRRTERTLDEFGLGSYREIVHREHCIYTRAANSITPEGKARLPRVCSCSWIVGKRRIHELDREA